MTCQTLAFPREPPRLVPATPAGEQSGDTRLRHGTTGEPLIFFQSLPKPFKDQSH